MVRKVLINSSSSTTVVSHRRTNSTTTTTTTVDPLSLSEHDDSSVSSTISVDHLPRKELHACESSSPLSRKRIALVVKKHVHFDLSRTTYHDDDESNNSAMEIDDENDTTTSTRWYTANEYREFKSLAQDASNQIIRIEARNRAPYSYQRVMEHVYTSCMLHPSTTTATTSSSTLSVLPDSELVHLQRWLDVATSRLGLEKWSIRKITRDKSYRRRELVKTVMNLQGISRQQQQYQQQSFLSIPLSSSEPTITNETIRTACEAISQPSRLYASTMATALAAAVANNTSSSTSSSQ